MLVIGLILVVIAALTLTAALVGTSAEPVAFDLGPLGWEMTPAAVFLSGAGSVVLMVLGLVVISSGVRRASRRRKEHKELARRSEQLEAHEAAQQQAPTTQQPPTTQQAPTTQRDTGATGHDPTEGNRS